MTGNPTVITVNTNWDYIADPNAVTLRDAIAETQLADSDTEYHIKFKKNPNVAQDPKTPKALNVGHFVIRLLAPLPNIYRNKVTINPGIDTVQSVILMPYFAGESEATEANYLSRWREIGPKDAGDPLGIGVPSSSILHIGDVNLVHDNYRSKSYTAGDGLPKVSLNSINFVKNIAKGGDGDRGAGGGVGVGGAITMTTGDLTINNSVFQDLEARGGQGGEPAEGGWIIPQNNEAETKCRRAYYGITSQRGYWNAEYIQPQRGGIATSPSVPIRNGDSNGGSSGINYVKIYNPNAANPGRNGAYQDIREAQTALKSQQGKCEISYFGENNSGSSIGESVSIRPTTFSGIYGGGGAGGSGGGSPGLKAPPLGGSMSVNWYDLSGGGKSGGGRGGPGGATIHGGGNGGRGNDGMAYTDKTRRGDVTYTSSLFKRWNGYPIDNQKTTILNPLWGGTKGQNGEGRGGAIAILNRGTNTRLTLNNVKFIDNKANGGSADRSKGHSIYSENLDTTGSANIYVKDIKYQDGDNETNLDASNLNNDSNSQFFNSTLYPLADDDRSSGNGVSLPSEIYSFGVSSPRRKQIADLTDMTLKGNEGISDIFNVNFESSESIVGISTNFNNPNNPFRQIWNQIETNDADSKLRTAKLEAEIEAKLLSLSNTSDFTQIGIASPFVATLGEFCRAANSKNMALGVSKLQIGCMATSLATSAIVSTLITKDKENIDSINGVEQTKAENAESLARRIDWLDSPETTGVGIGAVDLSNDRSVVFIDDFELGDDMIRIPIHENKMDGNEYVIKPEQFNDGTGGRNAHQVTFRFTGDINHFLRVRLSEESFDQFNSALKDKRIDDFFEDILQKKTKTKEGVTQKYWEIFGLNKLGATNTSNGLVKVMQPVNTGTPLSDAFKVDRSATGEDLDITVATLQGEDLLIGTKQNENLKAGSDNDIIMPYGGDDTIDGGNGIDTLAMTSDSVPLNLNVSTNNSSKLIATLPENFKFNDPNTSPGTVNTEIINVENFEFWGGSNIDLSGYQINSSAEDDTELQIKTGKGSTIMGWSGKDNIVISDTADFNNPGVSANNNFTNAKTKIDGGGGYNTLKLSVDESKFTIKYCLGTRNISITNNDSGVEILEAFNIDHLNIQGSDEAEEHLPVPCDSPNDSADNSEDNPANNGVVRALERKDIQSIGSIVYDLGGGDDHYNLRVGDQTIHGGRGNDTLKGFSNSDVLIGNSGKDYLVAKGRRDLLAGGQGDDTLISKGKNNYLIGGSGKDNYLLKKSGSNAVIITNGSGFVYGFNPQSDHLVFANIKGKSELTPAKSRKHFRMLIAAGDDQLIAYKNKIFYKNKRGHKKYKEIEFPCSSDPQIQNAVYTRFEIGDILDDQLNAELIDQLGFNPYASQ